MKMKIIDSLAKQISSYLRSRRFQFFKETMKLGPDDKILDVGAGAGSVFEASFKWPENVVAIDKELDGWLGCLPGISHLKKKHPVIKVVCADACRLPFKDRSFDIVFCNALIEHVGGYPEQRLVAKEIMRVTKGKFFVATPNKWFPVDQHYKLPFVHLLPKSVWKHLIEKLQLPWDDNLHLLTKSDLKILFPNSTVVGLHRFLGIPITLVAYSESKELFE